MEAKLLYLNDPSMNSLAQERRLTRLRKAVDDPALTRLALFFMQHASLVAYHMKSNGMPALVSDLKCGHLLDKYQNYCRSGGHAPICRSLFYHLWAIFFDDTQKARFALATSHVQGTFAFDRLREMLTLLASKIGAPFQNTLPHLLQVAVVCVCLAFIFIFIYVFF